MQRLSSRRRVAWNEPAEVKTHQSMWPLRVIGLLLVFGGLALGIFSATQFIQYRAQGEWPSITATLTSTRIERRWDSDKYKTYYKVVGIYSYVVAGQRHTFEEGQLEYQYIENANKHAGDFIGQTKTLWYNPASPGESFAFPALTGLIIVTLLGGLAALIIGGYFFVMEAPPEGVKRLLSRFQR